MDIWISCAASWRTQCGHYCVRSRLLKQTKQTSPFLLTFPCNNFCCSIWKYSEVLWAKMKELPLRIFIKFAARIQIFYRRLTAKVTVVLCFQCCWKFISNISNTVQAVTKYLFLMCLISHFLIVSVRSASDLFCIGSATEDYWNELLCCEWTFLERLNFQQSSPLLRRVQEPVPVTAASVVSAGLCEL